MSDIIFIVDILVEMKKINHSILVNFLELLDVLIDSPSQEEVKNSKFIKFTSLINLEIKMNCFDEYLWSRDVSIP